MRPSRNRPPAPRIASVVAAEDGVLNLVRAVLQRHTAQAGLQILIGQLGIDGHHMRQRAHRHAVLVGELLAVELLGSGPVAERLKWIEP